MNVTKPKALSHCTHLLLYAWHLLLPQYFKTFSMKTLKEKPIRVRIPRFFIPEDIARKARGIVKNDNVIKKLIQIAKNK